jgi:MraZ protein
MGSPLHAPDQDNQEAAAFDSQGATGQFERTLDDKGRVTIPPKFREAFGTSYVVARGNGGSLIVIPSSLWATLEENLQQQDSENHDRYYQFAIHNRIPASVDRQGRLKLPKYLLEWASLCSGEAVAIVGLGAKFEIWNKRAWELFVENNGLPEEAAEAGNGSEANSGSI